MPGPRNANVPDPAAIDTLLAQDTAVGLPTPFRRSVRLIALDIDGTLLRPDKRLSRASLVAIRAAQRRGAKVVLATARPPRGTMPVYQTLGLDTPTINFNGAVIYDTHRRRAVRHLGLDGAIALRIILVARRLDPKVEVHAHVLDRWCTDRAPQELASAPGDGTRQFIPDFIGPVEAFTSDTVTRILLCASTRYASEVADQVARRFAAHATCACTDDGMILVQHRKADKGDALRVLAAQMSLLPEQVMAIGDAANDVGMLRWAGIGVAMGNAWPAARRAADVVVPSNDDEGVAHAIERFVLNA